jgi:hypothetical protein
VGEMRTAESTATQVRRAQNSSEDWQHLGERESGRRRGYGRSLKVQKGRFCRIAGHGRRKRIVG